jgi:hypothetical protein
MFGTFLAAGEASRLGGSGGGVRPCMLAELTVLYRGFRTDTNSAKYM